MTWQRGRRSYIFKGEGWLQHPQTLQPPPRGPPGTRALHTVTQTGIGSPTETPDAPRGRGRLGAGVPIPAVGMVGPRAGADPPSPHAEEGAVVMEVDHDKQVVYTETLALALHEPDLLLAAMQPSEEHVAGRLTSPIVSTHLDTRNIAFERCVGGCSWRGGQQGTGAVAAGLMPPHPFPGTSRGSGAGARRRWRWSAATRPRCAWWGGGQGGRGVPGADPVPVSCLCRCTVPATWSWSPRPGPSTSLTRTSHAAKVTAPATEGGGAASSGGSPPSWVRALLLPGCTACGVMWGTVLGALCLPALPPAPRGLPAGSRTPFHSFLGLAQQHGTHNGVSGGQGAWGRCGAGQG